jgi:hypothetical protein
VRLLIALLATVLLCPAAALASSSGGRVPDDPSLPLVHSVDLSGVKAPARLPDAGAQPRIPAFLEFSHGGGVRAADHWAGRDVKEEQFRDEHGHVLTFATDNAAVDLVPFANLLASTYHRDEIEFVHVFVTSEATLTELCGASAAACYAADNPGKSPGGVMIISYEDSDIAHAVIHEYGHHIDTNTYNLGGLSSCGTSGDGSRRWFFARQMQDNILDNLSCDPDGDWGQLLPEVFAEDYAQMVGIPRAEYHPAIALRPPTARQKKAIRTDIDRPFAPSTRKVSGRSGASGLRSFRFRTSLPVFLAARKRHGVRGLETRGCALRGVKNVVSGTCTVVVQTTRRRGRFSFNLVAY